MPRLSLIPLLLAFSIPLPAAARAVPIPQHFDSVGTDRKAIEALLATYTNAVSTDEGRSLFETLLLNTSIPFSGVGSSGVASKAPGVTNQYQAFREGVFGGGPFTQFFSG